MFPIALFAAFTATADDQAWTTELTGAVQEKFAVTHLDNCQADITARVTAKGVLLTLDLPEAGRRTEQCDDALLAAFRDVALTVPLSSLLVDDVATVVVPLGKPVTTSTVGS